MINNTNDELTGGVKGNLTGGVKSNKTDTENEQSDLSNHPDNNDEWKDYLVNDSSLIRKPKIHHHHRLEWAPARTKSSINGRPPLTKTAVRKIRDMLKRECEKDKTNRKCEQLQKISKTLNSTTVLQNQTNPAAISVFSTAATVGNDSLSKGRGNTVKANIKIDSKKVHVKLSSKNNSKSSNKPNSNMDNSKNRKFFAKGFKNASAAEVIRVDSDDFPVSQNETQIDKVKQVDKSENNTAEEKEIQMEAKVESQGRGL